MSDDVAVHRLGILRLLEHEARVRPDDRVVVVDGDAELSYGGLFGLAGHVAQALLDRGLRRGQVVAVVAAEQDWIDFLVTAYGVYLAGGVLAPLAERLGPAGITAALDVCGDDVWVLTVGGTVPAVGGRPATTFAALTSTPTSSTDQQRLVLDPEPDSPACLVFSSGSTGVPRPVLSTWANVTFDHGNTPRDRSTPRRRFLTTLSIGSAVAQSLVHDSAAGPELVVATEPDPERLADLITRFRPQVVGLVPSVAAVLVSYLEVTPQPTDSVVLVVCGSAPLPVSLFRRIGQVFGAAEVYNSYGLTEGGVLVSRLGADPVDSVGQAADGVEVQVRDDHGRPVPDDTFGELFIREAGKPTRSVWGGRSGPIDADGWVRTGDRARVDAAGFVYLEGRTDEMVDVSGSKVSLPQTEAALSAHPDVVLAGVAALPHPVLGHRLVGVCRLRRVVDPTDLLAWANERLPGPAALHAVHPVDHVPLSTNRKLDRRALVDLAHRLEPAPAPVAAEEDDLEQVVLSLWRAALGQPELGAEDRLLNAGGHSLLAVEVALKLGAHLDRRVPIGLVLNAPTVRGAAAVVADELAAGRLAPRVRIASRRAGGTR